MKATSRLALALASGATGVVAVALVVPLLALGAGGLDVDSDVCPTPGQDTASDHTTPSILGPSTVTHTQLTGWWHAAGHGQPAKLATPIAEVIATYVTEGDAEGVRGDLAFAQAVHETGWFTSSDTAINNFAGIAHHDGARSGTAFPDARTGVRAHIQLLKKFAAGNDTALFHVNVAPDAAARADNWGELAGTWATDPHYWTALRSIYDDMLTHGAGTQTPPAECTSAPLSADVAGSLTNVRGITVHASIAVQLDQLLAAAQANGLALTGSGYRSHARQIELRRAHCGTSHYSIHEMPSSQCSPPTARPGASMHEQGLAIDFVNCSSHSTACWQWLNTNAAAFGFFNLPTESWHWSTSGA